MKNQLNFEVVSDEELLTTSGGKTLNKEKVVATVLQMTHGAVRIYLGLLLMVNNYY